MASGAQNEADVSFETKPPNLLYLQLILFRGLFESLIGEIPMDAFSKAYELSFQHPVQSFEFYSVQVPDSDFQYYAVAI